MPRPSFHPTTLDDPVARQTDWGPAASGGANFGTHRLIRLGPQRLEFKLGFGARLFPIVFIVMGGGVGGLFTAVGFTQDPSFAYIGLPTGLLFTGVGLWLLRRMSTPRVFDLQHGHYRRSRKVPGELNPRERGSHCRIEEIHALQLIEEWCSGNKSSYTSYELNLVLRDGSRLNVVDHGNGGQLRRDAEQLAEALGVPVWDATS